MLASLLLSGCATSSGRFSGSVTGVKQFLGVSQYYVKSGTVLRSQPDRTSKATGRLSPNSKVTEVTRNDIGWSRVKAAEGDQQGWLPTSLLSKQPVARTQKTESAREKSAEPAGSASKPASAEAARKTGAAPAVDAAETSGSGQSGGLLSPKSAEAATIPGQSKPVKKPGGERQANPDMFDAF